MPDRSELAAVLDDAVAFARRYVAMSAEQADTFALWVAHSHAVDAFDLSPLLAISSAEMRSGKTTTMKVAELLVARPWRVVTPSEAVVYRKIARDHPTLLLDEYDTVFGERDYEPLRAILNAGNEPGTTVPRCTGANRDQLDDFPIYCAKVLAGIGDLPSTVADRSIALRLKRKKRGEAVERFRKRDVRDAAEPLQQSLASILEHNVDRLADLRPSLPDELDDRAQDCWEPLLAIADLAGGDWPERARRAAVALAVGRAEEDSIRVRLLADCKPAFGDDEQLWTKDLIERLAEDDEKPWATWHKSGLPISPKALGAMLRQFDIHSKNIRIGDGVNKGYERAAFEDAWNRYLAPEPGFVTLHRYNPHGYRGNPRIRIRYKTTM